LPALRRGGDRGRLAAAPAEQHIGPEQREPRDEERTEGDGAVRGWVDPVEAREEERDGDDEPGERIDDRRRVELPAECCRPSEIVPGEGPAFVTDPIARG
jgi:hypothetical protein